MSSGKKKKFDAVGLMRSIRDQLVRETEGLSIADELRWWQTASYVIRNWRGWRRKRRNSPLQRAVGSPGNRIVERILRKDR